ncbi:N-acetyltransferase [Pseudomonas putida]|uniref:GNAT family N-acetyltransferase n=1 Tax=Pseudomonas putida TaxID=303 RepID=UPI002363F582|nr:N-acetyltransferase [Pseudomonas putida]MDD2139806.1 N-acetyltransferase [Pseudomonas putida]HDS1721730.1 N-acetyltransferase [Pseudomonas putida]
MTENTKQLTDPMDALVSLQQAVRRGFPTDPTGQGKDIRVVHDNPNGIPRYTYARIEHGRVKAIAILHVHAPIDGIACFALGYAVPEAYRNRGWAKQIVEAGIQELSAGLGRHGVEQFYVEAVVGQDNIASQRVANAVVSSEHTEGTDSESGLPVFSYTRLVKRR